MSNLTKTEAVKVAMLDHQYAIDKLQITLTELLLNTNFDDLKNTPPTYKYRVAMQKNKIEMTKLKIENHQIELDYFIDLYGA